MVRYEQSTQPLSRWSYWRSALYWCYLSTTLWVLGYADPHYSQTGESLRIYAGPLYGSLTSNGLALGTNQAGPSFTLTPDATIGFIAGGALLTDYTKWELDLRYTYFQTNGASEQRGVLMPQYTTFFTQFSDMVAQANGTFDVKYLTLTLKAPTFETDHFISIMGFGLAGMWNGEYMYMSFAPNQALYRTDLNYIMRSVGLRYYAALLFPITDRISLGSETGIATHFTRTRSRRSEKTGERITLRTERSERFSTLVLDTSVSLSYFFSLHPCKCTLDAGYLVQSLPSSAQYLLTSSTQTEGSLGIQGVFTTLSLAF